MRQQTMLRLFGNSRLTAYVKQFASRNLPEQHRDEGEQEAWAAIIASRYRDDHYLVARRAIWRYQKRVQKIRRNESAEQYGFRLIAPSDTNLGDPEHMN